MWLACIETLEQRLPIRIYIDNLLCPPLIYCDYLFTEESSEEVLDRVRYFLDFAAPAQRASSHDHLAQPVLASAASSLGAVGVASAVGAVGATSGATEETLSTCSSRSSSWSAFRGFAISATQPKIYFDVETPPVESPLLSDEEELPGGLNGLNGSVGAQLELPEFELEARDVQVLIPSLGEVCTSTPPHPF